MEAENQQRRCWMAVLAKAPLAEVQKAWDGLPGKPAFTFLRPPETGLVMVRGRAGGVGVRFNLGELPVTRCIVRIETGQVGCAYILGSSRRHAELAALFDALLQNRRRHGEIREQVIAPLAQIHQRKIQEQAAKTAATKVDFFTLVRGE